MSCVFASASLRRRGHQQVEAAFADPLEAGRREQRGDRPAAAAAAGGAQRLRVAVAEERRVLADRFLGEQAHRRVDRLLEARLARIEVDAERLEFVRQERAREAQLEPPVRDRVELRGLGRELDR